MNVEAASETAEDPGRLHYWLESLYPVRAHGEVIGVGAVFVDVTEQKAVEQEIEHSRRFLSAITDNMAEGMIATDNEGRVTFINAAAERLLGWRGDEMLGRSAHGTYHFLRPDGSPVPEEECPISKAWQRGETLHVDHDTFIRRDGTPVPVAYSISPSHTDQIGGAVMVFDDITERAAEQLRVERELEKLSWVGRIRDALDQDRFVLYAEPVVDLATGSVVQHELLIRMVSPEGEVIVPESLPADGRGVRTYLRDRPLAGGPDRPLGRPGLPGGVQPLGQVSRGSQHARASSAAPSRLTARHLSPSCARSPRRRYCATPQPQKPSSRASTTSDARWPLTTSALGTAVSPTEAAPCLVSQDRPGVHP